MAEELLTVEQMADLLQVKKSTLYSWTHLGWIPHVKVGRLVRFRREAVEAWLKSREVNGRASQVPTPERNGLERRARC